MGNIFIPYVNVKDTDDEEKCLKEVYISIICDPITKKCEYFLKAMDSNTYPNIVKLYQLYNQRKDIQVMVDDYFKRSHQASNI